MKITYGSGINRRVATAFAKVPYGGIYALTETLTRAIATGEVRWFRIEPAKPAEIAEVRGSLQRWPQALAATQETTKVTWLT